jgi:GNAT superfamily N-acetyltransferase
MIKVDGIHKIRNYKKITNDDSPSFSGIVSGECKGNLWVDEIENPSIAIADSYAVGSYGFLGEIKSDEEYKNLKAFIDCELLPMLKAKGNTHFEFSIEEDKLEHHILKMFADKEIEQEKEYSYRKNDKIIAYLNLPAGYTIHKVGVELWNQINEGYIENGTFLTKRILESWESFDIFVRTGLAYCIMYSTRIVSVIVGTGRFRDSIAIDIETEKFHQNKGLGFIMTAKFVNECERRGLTAQWDCVESNPVSKKLAEKAGFKFLKQNQVYWFRL